MQLIKRVVPAVCIVLVCGCVSQRDMRMVQRDVDEMRTRVFGMERDMSGIRTETKEGLASTAKDYQKELDALRKGVADLQASLDAVKVDAQVLTGKAEEAQLMARKPADELTLLREDTNRRFTALEERLAKLEKGLVEEKPKEVELTGDALYQKGLETLRANDPVKARELFGRFLEKNPRHQLVGNAHFWLGETYYSEKKYDQAILEYQEVVSKFAGIEKAPAALYKQGMSFRQLQDDKSARYVLNKLIKEYPLSDEVKRAKELLKQIK